MKKGGKKRVLQLIGGTFLMAVAYKSIYDSAQMVTGGFSGIGVIVRYLTMEYVSDGVPMWLTNTVLNIPLFAASYFIRGKKFIFDTIVGTVLLTFFLGILPSSSLSETDYLLAAVAGGVIHGTGIGMVLNAGATTGGTDMLAVLLSKYVKQYSVVRIMQLLDGAVIAAGVLVFGIRVSMYAIIAIYISTLVSDSIIEGVKSGKAAWIISDHYAAIAEAVMKEMERGITLLDGSGMYSGNRKNVMLCVVSKKQVPRLKKIVAETDDKAFLIIGDVREVCGEGFVQITH